MKDYKNYLLNFLYLIYSYIANLIWIFLEICPHVIRNLAFKLLLKRYGRHCLLDYQCFIRYPWRVSIGSNASINRGCELYPSMRSKDGFIILEDNVSLGPGVIIFSAGHDYSTLDLPDISLPVIIKKDAWVGGKTVILPGVTIGEAAVIGAGSVVREDIPDYSIAAGNPALVIGKRVLEN